MGESKRGKQFYLNKRTRVDIKFQLKQNALFSIFFSMLHDNKEFFKITEGDEAYTYDTDSMFFTKYKLLKDDEVRPFELEVAKFNQAPREYFRSIVKATAEIKLTRVLHPESLTGDLENDRPAIQYLELAFGQTQRPSGEFLSFGNKFYSKKSSEEIERALLGLKEGVTRSIWIIGDPADKKLMVQVVPTNG